MQDFIGSNGSLSNVPRIPANLTRDNAHLVIPAGFEDILKVTIKSNEIHLELLNDEYKENVIVISDTLYNPVKNFVQFPHFLITRNKDVDYFQNSSDRYVFNQNEILYITLQHRLVSFLGYNKAFSNLLKRDIAAVKSFVQYVPSIAYNAIQKNENSYIVMSIFEGEVLPDRTLLGDLIHHKSYIPTMEKWVEIMKNLPLQCSSESGCSKTGKIVIYPYSKGNLYRSVGHQIFFNQSLKIWSMKSLFKSAQNITARNKTHVTANAYEQFNFVPTSNFIQDWIYDEKNYPVDKPVLEGYKPKDSCYKRALVVIRPMNHDTQQYLFGECEVNEDFYDNWVWETKTILDSFDELCIPEDGTTVHADTYEDKNGFVSENNNIVIGRADELGQMRDIVLKDVKAVKFLKRKLANGPLGKEKVTVRLVRKAGNARLDSNTGFKAVTKGKPYLGKILLEDGTELRPDMAFGMNSFKAKQNGIKLARAALAVDLKTYKPKHWSNLLNTFDEDEINAASSSLPNYKFYDEFGNYQENVQIGVIYYRYTELCSDFKSYRPQSMSHETGRNLFHNQDNTLFNFLWNNYVNQDMKEALIEFQKILCGSTDFKSDEGLDLPYISIKDLQRKRDPFFTENDYIFNKNLNSRSGSKLLKDEFNLNGFYIDCRANKGPLLRVPSAKVLRMFEKELDTGEWMYHSMFISLSKILRALSLPKTVFHVINKNETSDKNRDTHSKRYLRDIKGIIFTTDESSEMNITALSRPMVPGIAMKQSVDVLLPNNTVLIACNKTYQKALKNCYGEDADLEVLKYGFHGFHVRNPSLWRTQLVKLKIWSADDYRVYLMSRYGISLDQYLLTSQNKDLIIFSKDVFAAEHSDSDGDHSATFIPHSTEGQKIMRDFVLSDVCKEELEWTEDYVQGEFDADDSLIDSKGNLIDEPYKLYDVPLQDYFVKKEKVNCYSTYFLQSLEAKANIGSSTNDGWIFAMILEAYQQYAIKNNYQYQDPNNPDNGSYQMINLRRDKFFKYHFTYIRGLQDFVVTGVKHNDNGSADFESLFLRNIADESNSKKVREILTGPLGLDPKSASDIIRIVSWAETTGFRLACSSFLKLYNKGTVPYLPEVKELLDKHEEFIQQNTYFGMLLKPIYDIMNEHKSSQGLSQVKMELEMKAFLEELESSM